ncbi:uncharacterized protein LOC132279467 [Cornus florida]|uniref:uncharacterized protein LOC132279467 n=1 Tax=Cornus florida TaxID=4283 RepID=UPI00289A550A|nr:uncharacterized protein LOC132279467 [Cornus florida]
MATRCLQMLAVTRRFADERKEEDKMPSKFLTVHLYFFSDSQISSATKTSFEQYCKLISLKKLIQKDLLTRGRKKIRCLKNSPCYISMHKGKFYFGLRRLQTSYPFDDLLEWSASSQLDLLGAKLSIPTPGESRASNLLANSVFTINCVQFITLWCSVAALPCQGRRLETRFFPEGSMEEYTWYKPLGLIWNRINVAGCNVENLTCSGLLTEVCQIERYAREIPDLDEYWQSSERRAQLSQMEEEIRRNTSYSGK